MPTDEMHALRQQLVALQQRNRELEVQLLRTALPEDGLYRFVFNSMDVGCCIIEFFDGPSGPLSDYLHVLANAACLQHAGIADPTGYTARELVPDEADFWIERYSTVLRSGEPLQFEQELLSTGRVLAVTCFRIEPADKRQVAVLFKDVTERRRADLALLTLNQQLEHRSSTALAERRLFAELVDHSIANVHVINSDLRWLAINRQARHEFCQLYGQLPQVGDYMPALMARNPLDRDMIMPLWQRALAGEHFTIIEAFGDAPQRRHFELRFHALLDPAGTVQGAYLFAYDISERVEHQQRLLEAEQALRQAQKMEAVGQLSGGIAHDFNNLLGGILGAHELMQQRLEQGRHADLGRLLDTANGSAQRASALVHRLLAFSRKQTLQPQPTQVGALINGMEDLIRRSIGPTIALHSHFSPGIWPTFIDPPQLESALLNLCINARDAMPRGGTIRIDGANIVLDDAQAGALDLSPGDYMCLAVGDNGQGMSAEVSQRAIDPFFTTKPLGQGSGLGLSMVYGFVRQSGGQLHIVSEAELGTRVRLYLPRHLQALDSPLPPSSAERLQAPRQTQRIIMLVEDQPTMCMVICEVLEELGHRVHAFDTGTAAVAALHAGLRPDLLISDIGLPGGLDGYQVAKACLQTTPHASVLYITGYDPNTLMEGCFPEAAQLLLKPFELATLVERVDLMLAD
ncbi:Blue-light-activated protein [Pseudomonas reidholzensis]|uniref:histidine kinase n=1 Tax=Pseudomonas reidholzensis TaxID=1785162 RepID=A0A383RUP0_9PSED|nr:PAS domain-containing sensor histidine kinase [Pseudomonas reidholzensis]SYX90615.1 Blue-light-activated protein [Pseudomonas reidholzensis]